MVKPQVVGRSACFLFIRAILISAENRKTIRGVANIMPDEDRALTIRRQSWDAAVHAYGTGYIFAYRNNVLKRRLNVLTYIGLVVPLVIGLLVIGYGNFKGLKVLLAIAIAIGVCQVAVSLWSIVGGWVAGYAYSTSAISENYQLADRYVDLARNPPSDLGKFRDEYDKLKVADDAIARQDYQQSIKDEETRMGMRAALRKFGRACAGCGGTPTDMKPGKCGVCGNFHYKIP
jgi:mobilome CxxCx(11)CxxC protein